MSEKNILLYTTMKSGIQESQKIKNKASETEVRAIFEKREEASALTYCTPISLLLILYMSVPYIIVTICYKLLGKIALYLFY